MHKPLLFLVAMAALAGCADGPVSADPITDPVPDPAAPPGNLTALLALDLANGTAPLQVNFTIDALNATDNATWVLDFGDGNTTEARELPTTANHTFQAGNHTVLLTVTDGNRTAQADLLVSVTEAAPATRTLPETTHWELGPAGPCIHDVATTGGGPTTPCAGLLAGPDAPVTDGHWIALGPEYWGLQLVSTIDRGDGHGSSGDDWPLYDSDCWFLAEDAETQTGDGHAGGAACAGIIPEGSHYVFIAPYLLPAVEIVVDVTLP